MSLMAVEFVAMKTRFSLDGKSIYAKELNTGDLEISGYAVVWDGLDADGETFVRGAMREAIPAFLESGGVLAWNHRPADHPLGRVLEMREDDIGVFFKGRVDAQAQSSPLRWLYDSVKRGTMRGVSCGGYFGTRRPTAFGDLIERVLRITEVSLTTHPKDANPRLHNVTEVKAMMARTPVDTDALLHEARMLSLETDLAITRYKLADLIVNGPR